MHRSVSPPDLTVAVPPARLADLGLRTGRQLWARLRPQDVEVYR